MLVLIFNLIGLPLDGGRIARAIAWKVTGNRNRATPLRRRRRAGLLHAFIALGLLWLLAGNVLGGIWLALIGFILAQSARGSAMRSSSPAGSRASAWPT